MERKILLLGSGYVAGPTVEYLLRRKENIITIASAHLKNAQALKDKFSSNTNASNLSATSFDVKDVEGMDKLISTHEIVISLIPWSFHALVIKSAIKYKKNVVTTSYVNPFMLELNEQAKEAGITVLNEVGVDPGIDHFYALKTINEVHSQGGKILSFISFCGGLPAPEASNNPLGYKFSWSPKGVLLAIRSPAKYLSEGKVVEIAGPDLLKSAKPVFVYPAFALEGYPNRDSTPYDKRYNIPEAHTIMRGTLRYQGNPSFMQAIVDCGFLNEEPQEHLKEGAAPITWRESFAKLLGCGPTISEIEQTVVQKANLSGEKKEKILKGFKWLGLLSEEQPPQNGNYLDSLAKTLEGKMQYADGERDMLILQHKFEIELKDGKKETRTSTLLEYGIPHGDTSMARTVGIPCGIATQLMLDGKFSHLKGVLAPMTPDIYEPIMHLLEKEGIKVIEETL